MTHGSLFSGIGGFDLAAQWMGWENVFHCEWNDFGKQILKHYWPQAIGYDDITKTDFTPHRGAIDVLSGGFPCQGFSLAGLRMGTDDARYLWPEMLRCVDETQPTWIVGENVTGILGMEDKSGVQKEVFPKMENRTITRLCEIDEYEAVYTRQAKMLVNSICQDLEKRGYEVQTFTLPAASVGAPHRRDRVWFLAYTDRSANCRTPGQNEKQSGKERLQKRYEVQQSSKSGDVWGFSTNPNCTSLQRRPHSRRLRNFPTESPFRTGDDGLPAKLGSITFPKWRNESIKGGGNAIVPQVAYEIFKVIEQCS